MDKGAKQTVLDWIDLLRYPKTKRVAVRCFLYMAEAFKNDSTLPQPPQVKRIPVNDRYSNSEVPAKYEKHTVYWETYKCTLTDPNSEKSEKKRCSFKRKELPDYAELLATSIIALLQQPPKTTWGEIFSMRTVESTLMNCYKQVDENTEYTQYKRSREMGSTMKTFDEFIAGNGEFTKKMADIVLTTITSIANLLHIDRATPIHLATINNDLDAVITLLSNNVKVNERNKQGLTPLHIAVKNDVPIIVKTLVLFDADATTEKKELRRLALSPQVLQILKDSCRLSTTRYHRLHRDAKRRLKNVMKSGGEKTHLLSLDGGGIRGLVLTTILTEIEAVAGKNTIRDRFSFIAGSSTGAILAIALSQGKTVAECRNIYFRLKDVVFYRKSLAVDYSHELLEDVFIKELNGLAKMASLKNDKGKFVIITSCDNSVSPTKTVLFNSYTVKDYLVADEIFQYDAISVASTEQDNSSRARRFSLESVSSTSTPPDPREHTMTSEQISHFRRSQVFRDSNDGNSSYCPYEATIKFAARCSSAAPTFFASPDDNHTDGGILANNPCEHLLNEFIKVNNAYERNAADKMNLGVVLSLGTGHIKDQPASNCEPKCGFKFASVVIRFIQQFSGQIGRSDGPHVQHTAAHTRSLNGLFYRCTPELKTDVCLDETSNEVLIEMMWTTKLFVRKERRRGTLNMIDHILKM